MKTFLFAILLLNSICVYSQPQLQWEKSFGGTNLDEPSSVFCTRDGGFIMAGKSSSYDGDVTGMHGYYDFWIVKTDSTGNLEWEKSLGGFDDDEARSIVQTFDGGYIVAGLTESIDGDVTGNHGLLDYWIVKLDSTGNIEWNSALGGGQADAGYSIIQSRDSGYVVVGYSRSGDGDVTVCYLYEDFWVVKLNNAGQIQWQKTLGGNNVDWALSIVQTYDDGFAVTGFTRSNDSDVTTNNGDADYWITRLDQNGTLLWEKSLGGSRYDQPNSIKETTDHGFIIAGYTQSYDSVVTGNHGAPDCWIVKLDSTGNLQWQKCLGGTSYETANDIIQTLNGDYIVAGSTQSNDGNVSGIHGLSDVWIVALDSSGSIEWQKCFGGTSYDYPGAIQQTIDGGFIIAADSRSSDGDVSMNHGDEDYWLIKLSNPLINRIDEKKTSTINCTINPNPFNSETKISFTSQSDQKVSVEIRDLQGSTVKNFNSEYFNQGRNQIVWDGSANSGRHINPGIYIVRLIIGNFIVEEKIVAIDFPDEK